MDYEDKDELTEERKTYWFCPCCGNPMYYVSEKDMKIGKRESGAYEVCCKENKCVMGLSDLRVHHPYHGTNSGPGDSWSISWIK